MVLTLHSGPLPEPEREFVGEFSPRCGERAGVRGESLCRLSYRELFVEETLCAARLPGAAMKFVRSAPSLAFHTRTSPSKLPVARRPLAS